MSAQPIDPGPASRAAGAFAPMQLSDVAGVAAIERSIYTAPWSEGNFVDSLNAGYCAWTLRAPPGGTDAARAPIIGYFVLMAAVGEAHLLNVSVAVPWQGRGHGLHLLRQAIALALDYRAQSVLLEVRPSNHRALAVYRRFGFRDHGLRRRYYPASASDHQNREDALVLRLPL
jgi:[ribosomal protein S18]-alanine N-acetyltransferase